MDTNLNITPTADMPPVTTTTSGSTTGTTASGITPSDEARLASSLEQEALKSQAGFTAAQGEQIPIVEEQKAAGTDAQATALEAQALEAQKVRDNYLQRISYAQTQSDRARQRYESFQFHNYWDSLTTGQQVQSRIAAFMGGFVQGVNGGQNVALQSLMSAADRDFEAQKAQLGKSERSAEWASKGVTDLYGQMQHDLAALEVKHGRGRERRHRPGPHGRQLRQGSGGQAALRAALRPPADVEGRESDDRGEGRETGTRRCEGGRRR
jgi:hypothetical protein